MALGLDVYAFHTCLCICIFIFVVDFDTRAIITILQTIPPCLMFCMAQLTLLFLSQPYQHQNRGDRSPQVYHEAYSGSTFAFNYT